MSRNFELLQQLGRDAGMTSGGVATADPEPVAPAASSVDCVQPLAAKLPQMQERSREQIVKLVRQLFQAATGGRVIVMAGIEPGNGGTWVLLQCARVLTAQATGAVCLVDGNLRTPALHDRFGVPNHHGFSDLIRQGGALGDYVQRVEGPRNLWFLSCGSETGPDGTGAVLNLQALRARMQDLRAAFEYVLIDAPSMSVCSDALILGQAADGVALVIAEQDTRKETARNAVEELNRASVRVLGAVLNKRTFPIPQRIYDRL